jgi:galactokinase/mevalonate kinase-like predicted kinase
MRTPTRLRISAPARANLVGNPSDLSGGAVLACSVPLRAHVSIEPCDTTEIRTGSETVRITDERDLDVRGDRLDLGRAALRGAGVTPPCRIEYGTEIPLQSGLAGSTALLVGLLQGILIWSGRERGPYELAELARRVEREILGVTCGFVDQYLCTFGGLQYVDFRGKEVWRPADEQPLATVEPLEDHVPALPFVLGFTGVRHDSGAVHAPAQARLERGDREALEAHARMAEIAREGKTALMQGSWSRLGDLMNENHALQRDLGGSGEDNERLIEAALGAGATGAKLAGAGHGGTIVALCPQGSLSKVEEALRGAGAAATYLPEPVPGVRVDADEGVD